MFTGPGVHRIVHVGPDHDVVHRPDLSQTEWECAFIQSNSADRTLKLGTRFLYCKLKFMGEVWITRIMHACRNGSTEGGESCFGNELREKPSLFPPNPNDDIDIM